MPIGLAQSSYAVCRIIPKGESSASTLEFSPYRLIRYLTTAKSSTHRLRPLSRVLPIASFGLANTQPGYSEEHTYHVLSVPCLTRFFPFRRFSKRKEPILPAGHPNLLIRLRPQNFSSSRRVAPFCALPGLFHPESALRVSPSRICSSDRCR